MLERRRYLDSAVREDTGLRPVAASSPAVSYSVEAGKYCVYNQT